MTDVSAVVVNYNAREYLVPCVRSLREAGVSEIVVADNDSRDGSAEALAAAEPDAKFVPTGGNFGFGGGANRGAALVSGEYIVVCNPDITIEPDAVDILVAAMEKDGRLAIVGPLVRNPDGSVYPTPRVFPRLLDAAGHAFLGMLAPRNRFTRRYRMLDLDRSVPSADVDWVSGSFFLARREAWDALGGFDEGYFMYAEDTDLCWRAHRAGWRVGFEPAARVTHVQGASTDKTPYRMIVAHHRSLLRFSSRTAAGAERALLPFVAVALALRTVIALAHRAARRPATR
ncbi:MAG: glycosyltransferase family 2 protein [Actinobacteria bacterium]|nr:glycosyltransferase family 2 protein [Actinomycetota bacterium]